MRSGESSDFESNALTGTTLQLLATLTKFLRTFYPVVFWAVMCAVEGDSI
jgi:hypothetical protein